jgi:AAA domain/Bifunctional DNA primase/polymerase, N-terminal/Primase C terminal 2 (PriCT-2)
MSRASSDVLPFGLAFTEYAKLGYDPIPIIPHDKRPGVIGTKLGLSWSTRSYDLAWLDKHHGDHGTGLRCGHNVVGIDIDLDDKKLAAKAEKLIRQVLELPQSTPRRVGRHGAMLIVACSEKFKGWDITEHDKKGAGRTLLQFLGEGRQFVIKGIHPTTGKPYMLEAPLPPVAQLPVIKPESFKRLDVELIKFFAQNGIDADSGQWVTKAKKTGEHEHARWNDVNIDWGIARLKAINPECSRDEWVRVGFALHAAFHGDDDGLDLFNAWASGELRGEPVTGPSDSDPKRKKYEPKACVSLWRYAQPGGGINPGTLDAIAKKHGFTGVQPEEPEEAQEPSEDAAPEEFWSDWNELTTNEVEDVSWLIPGWLPGGCVTLYNGDGGSGKSFCGLEIAIRIALGESVFGKKITRQKVAFISGEDDTRTLYHRAKRIAQKLGHSPKELAGWLFMRDASCDNNVLFSEAQGTANGRNSGIVNYWTARFDLISNHFDECGAKLLVLDNSSDVYDANENDRAKVKQFLSGMSSVIDGSTAILLLAHVNAETAKLGESGKGYSGSTAWNNGVRSRWFQWRDQENAVHLKLMKSNYAPPGLEVAIAWNDTTMTFDLGDEAKGIDINAHAGLVLRLIRQCIDDGVNISPSPQANNNFYKMLSRCLDYPKRIDKKSLFGLLDEFIRGKFVEVVDVKDAKGKVSKQIRLTGKGKQGCRDE